ELDPLLGDTESAVFGLNESGQAVGRSGDDATGRAVLWNFAPAPSPVPALSALALVLLGLGVLWTGRRALSRPGSSFDVADVTVSRVRFCRRG
ncbi:MAG: hypothetical protein JRS35_12845, partial [Deltaproteobacteria bacterium]|nr:hypothetical protein [Deltaproteobacteria bacterium]